MKYPARVAAVLGSIAALAAALAPAVANLDIQSSAGVIAGVGAIALIVTKWLAGQQQHEAIQATDKINNGERVS